PALPDNGHTARRQVANKLANRVLTPFLIVGWVVMTTSPAVSTTTIPASVAQKKIKTVLPTGTRDHKIPLVQVILQHFEVCSPADFDATPAARQRGDRIDVRFWPKADIRWWIQCSPRSLPRKRESNT